MYNLLHRIHGRSAPKAHPACPAGVLTNGATDMVNSVVIAVLVGGALGASGCAQHRLGECGTAYTPSPCSQNGPLQHPVDPIDELVRYLSGNPLWQNGLKPTIPLPRSAGPAQIAAVFLKTQHATLLDVIAIRDVRISGPQPDRHTAVLVNSSLGRKIILLCSDACDAESGVCWSVRMFDAY